MDTAGAAAAASASAGLSSWLALRMSREVRRLASVGQRALPLPVSASAAERRRLRPTDAADTVINVLRVCTSFDFAQVRSLLVSPPERAPPAAAQPGASHACFVVLLTSDKPECPALLANFAYDEAAVGGNDLRFFAFVREDGSETIIEVRDAQGVAPPQEDAKR